jgi:hypothetical protein
VAEGISWLAPKLPAPLEAAAWIAYVLVASPTLTSPVSVPSPLLRVSTGVP